MTVLKIATSLYIVQAGIGLAAGFTIPWLALLQDPPAPLCSVSEARIAAWGDQDAEREEQRARGTCQERPDFSAADF
jgi:hypothetical protein